MTGNTTALTRVTAAAQAKDNRAYVRRLLKERQPQFAAALEWAAAQLLPDHETVYAWGEWRPALDMKAALSARCHGPDEQPA
jgi:hypothetical protein